MQINEPIFIVSCERISKRQAYYVRFMPNNQLLERVKSLPEETRKWSALNLAWEITTHSLFLLIKKYKNSTKIHFDFGSDDSRKIFIEQIKKIEITEAEKRKFIAELNVKKEQWVQYKKELEETYEKYRNVVEKYLKPGTHLYPHQIVAVMFINVVKNVLLALDMGSGKSISAIAACEMNGFEKIIVITPSSLKFNYYNEIKKFTNSNAYIVNWNKNDCIVDDAKYIIINYDYFNSSNNERAFNKWSKLNIKVIDAIILDECQKLKNSKTSIFKNFKKIFNDKIFRNGNKFSIYLSGTPMVNRAKELYNVLHEISPLDFKTKKYFYEYYLGMTYNYNSGYGWSVNECDTKFEELFNKISPFTYRKKLEDIVKDLPDKSYQKIILELDDYNQKLYNDIELGVYNEFTKSEVKNPLSIMLRLRQFTSQNKIDYAIEIIDNILESGEKIVIFDVFKDSLKILHNKFSEISVLHTGDVSIEDRNEYIKKFQDKDSEIKLFFTTFSSGNFGLTLTQAQKMILLTLPYSLGEYSQAASRIYRIGQKNNVIIYPIIFKNTIDEYVYSMIESKQTEISKVLDNVEYESNINESVFNDVINSLKNKYLK